MSPPSGEKGDGMKRKRESADHDKVTSKKRTINRSEKDRSASKKDQDVISLLGKSKKNGSRLNQGKNIEHPGQHKRKLESQDEAKKKIKSDPAATTSSATIAPRGLEQYNIHRELGRGAFAAVYLASTKNKATAVAIKAIAKNQEDSSPWQEKKLLLRLSGNPYICRAYAGFQTISHAFLVLEYLPGGNLEDVLESKGPLDVKTTALCTAQVICGLQHLHNLKVIHRDIKAENILIDQQGHIRICDFGMAAENLFGTICGFAGTPYYMSPEMLYHEPYNSAVDWWALGVLIFRLLTNSFPFCGGKTLKEYRHIVLKQEPIYPDHLTADTKDIMNKLLCKERRRRLGWEGEIRQHPFYGDIDWEKIEKKTSDPPFPPGVNQKTCSPSQDLIELPFLQFPEGDPCPPKAIRKFSFEDPEWSY